MATRDRLTVLATILEVGFVPTFTPSDVRSGLGAIRACQLGGARVIELTARGDGAYETIRALLARVQAEVRELIVGVGTVLDAPTAALFIAAGAAFIVSPALDEETVRLCNRRRVACLPGAFTPSEVARAEELGCEIVKLFPQAAVDGPAFIRSVLGPMPASRLMPTNVIFSEESIVGWFRAGAAAVGIGPGLVTTEALAGRDDEGLAQRTGTAARWVELGRREAGR